MSPIKEPDFGSDYTMPDSSSSSYDEIPEDGSSGDGNDLTDDDSFDDFLKRRKKQAPVRARSAQ